MERKNTVKIVTTDVASKTPGFLLVFLTILRDEVKDGEPEDDELMLYLLFW